MRRRPLSTLFLTGGSGLLGAHVQRSPLVDQWQLVAPTSRSLDIRDGDAVRSMIRDWRPAVVLHLAYRRDDRPTIVDGSRHVAQAAAACGARLVHVSTDVVFGGRPAPYGERDRPDPVIAYGRWKAEAEAAVAAEHPAAAIVRTSLLYADSAATPAPCQVDVRRALSGESPMTFFTDEVRCPAPAADVADACLRLVPMDVAGPIHVAGPPLSRAAFAAAIARWLGADPNRLRTASLTSMAGEKRPGRVVLDTSFAAGLGIRCRSVAEVLRS
jgi:dTDP-4-dehydrorhamnose reductase